MPPHGNNISGCAELLRRRWIWWPTFRGFALLLVFVAAISWWARGTIYPFLAVTEPSQTGPVVVVGWQGRRTLAVAIEESRKRGGVPVYVSGRSLDPRLPIKG